MDERAGSLLQRFTRYVPALVLDRLQRTRHAPDAASEEFIHCAVMFADISGFTPLTEAFAARGPAGAESLTRILNDYFGKLIEEITVYGGDLVKFAGDAVTVLWQASDASDAALERVTLQAASCSLAVQSAVRGYDAQGHTLSLKVAVGAGPLAVIHVGGEFGRWEFAIAGEPLHQVGRAGDVADAGDVLVSEAAWRLIRAHATSTAELEGGARRLDTVNVQPTISPYTPPQIDSELEAAVRGYLPAAITRRLLAGQSDYLGELRTLTILFINLPGMRYDTPLEKSQQAMRSLQKALYFPYEGSINKLSVDDKGITLIAALGMPPFAHEDDPSRGALAALAMSRALTELSLASSIGVTTGRVYCGAVGSDLRLEYTIMGDKVNLAARLMQNAKGGVLCDADTFERARQSVRFAEVRTIKVKGKSAPVAVHEPLGPASREQRVRRADTTLIGRKAELAALAEAARGLAEDHKSGAVVIEGEAGVGKSRLLQAFLTAAADLHCRVLASAADAIEQSRSYYAWQDLLLGLLYLADVAPAERAARLAKTLENDAEALRLLPLLNAILALEIPETPFTFGMSGEVRASNTQRLIASLLSFSAARRPLAIVIDDVHWMDSASWSLLAAIRAQISPLLVVVLTRPLTEASAPELRQMIASPTTRHVLLERMTPDETVEMVARRLHVPALPEPAARLIRERAEGHPFFAEEIGYALRDGGHLVIEGGACRMAHDLDGGVVELPATVEGIITARIDRLEPAQQLTVKVASVIGRVFDVRLLHDVYPVTDDRDAVPGYLRALERLDLTPVERPEPNAAYLFKHIITQQVAYDLMLLAQRRDLHRTIAQWYETEHGGDLSRHYALLAHHWRRAEDSARAIDYLELAAEQAIASNASVEALRLLDELDLLARSEAPSRNRRAVWLLLRGRAHRSVGRLDNARSAYEAGMRALEMPMPATTGGVVGRLLFDVVRQAKHRRIGSPAPPNDPDARRRLDLAGTLAEELFLVYFFDNDVVRTVYATLRSINICEAAGTQTSALVRGYVSLAIALEALPAPKLADAYLERGFAAIGEDEQNDSIRAWSCTARSVCHGGRGAWEEASADSERARAINRTIGDDRAWEESSGNYALLRTLMGRFDDPDDSIYVPLLESGLRRDSLQVKGWGYALRAINMHHKQRLDDLAATLDRFETVFLDPQFKDAITRLEGISLTAQRFLRDGDDARSLEFLTLGIDVLGRLGLPSQYRNVPSAQMLAEAAIEWWRRHRTDASARQYRRWRDQAIGYVRTCSRSFVIARPKVDWLRGKVAFHEGRRSSAVALWRRSLHNAHVLRMPYDELLAAEALGRHGDDKDAWRRAKALMAEMRTGTPLEVLSMD